MTEYEEALALANRLLDEPNADPDDDLRMLARQFLRAVERADRDFGRPGMCEPITYVWLKSHGWRELAREEQQPAEHVRRDIGGELAGGRPFLGSFDDIGLELAYQPDRFGDVGVSGSWYCWITQQEPRRHIHVRHLRTVGEVVRLWEGLTGKCWPKG